MMKTIHNTKIIGIDHGYGNMKTANCCFPTGITAYEHEPLFTADMLVYGGRYYLIGEGHKEFAPDKIKDEDYYVLTLAAIARELKTENLTEAHIVIAAGLPLTWTSGQKADFKEYLMKNAEVEFSYKKADYHLYIDDVRIYPQGYAAIASFATTLKGVNLIADIGNGTMNTLYMINGKPQQGKMFTEKFGTYQCTLAVREAFMQRTRRENNDAIIDEVLITGTANIAPADLKIIKSVAAEYVRDIFRRLREHGYDENTMTLYVTGGGGCLVKNFYKFSTDRVKFVEDICAAAKGYEYRINVRFDLDKPMEANAAQYLQSLDKSRNAFMVAAVLNEMQRQSSASGVLLEDIRRVIREELQEVSFIAAPPVFEQVQPELTEEQQAENEKSVLDDLEMFG